MNRNCNPYISNARYPAKSRNCCNDLIKGLRLLLRQQIIFDFANGIQQGVCSMLYDEFANRFTLLLLLLSLRLSLPVKQWTYKDSPPPSKKNNQKQRKTLCCCSATKFNTKRARCKRSTMSASQQAHTEEYKLLSSHAQTNTKRQETE